MNDLKATNPTVEYAYFDAPQMLRVWVDLNRDVTDTERWVFREVTRDAVAGFEIVGDDKVKFKTGYTGIAAELRSVASILRDVKERAEELDDEMDKSETLARQSIDQLMQGRTFIPPHD